MSEIRKWLETIGLGQYADAFETNEIGMDLLGQVDDQILKDIGVSAAGHRMRIRDAIAKLAPAPTAEVNLSTRAFSKHCPPELDFVQFMRPGQAHPPCDSRFGLEFLCYLGAAGT